VAQAALRAYIVDMVFPPFDPSPPPFRRRFKAIPVRTLLPNLITLLALCAGLTAIRLSVEDKLELALAAIVFAALLDGIDGRIARFQRYLAFRRRADVSRLRQFRCCRRSSCISGVCTNSNRRVGLPRWFCVCAGLRLAFNVMIDG
jgi:CDP-diacylglycerol--serine O-phosphatidyltransferase